MDNITIFGNNAIAEVELPETIFYIDSEEEERHSLNFLSSFEDEDDVELDDDEDFEELEDEDFDDEFEFMDDDDEDFDDDDEDEDFDDDDEDDYED